MGEEIERKFLIADHSWRDLADEGTLLRQGYLSDDPQRTVRVRLAGTTGYLTIKGESKGAARAEFEFEIPGDQAARLLDDLCLRPLIEKRRYLVKWRGKTWEIDEFSGVNEGLLVAEVELDSPDEVVDIPAWAGREVTTDPRYYNASLVSHPFSTW